ncbi:MAG: glyoxalase [Actinomycetia bacterium]|nr:glyoxalase [Actinomycetes bacterium]
MPLPQRITVVTLGARSVAALRAFYAAMGWVENDGSDETYASFTTGSLRLALYPIELLGQEAAPGDRVAASDTWNGVTLGVNVATREEVDEAFASALAAGAQAIQHPTERSWGGYSGYIADPEGHRWELAWAPWFTTFD